MYYDEIEQQWNISSSIEESVFGMPLRRLLLRSGCKIITSGTIMTFVVFGKPAIMFQVLGDINVETLGENTLIGYEPGSLVYSWEFSGCPTLRFRQCRMPTLKELLLYRRNATI